MSKISSNSDADNYDFSMKHRLVGAAILISFAVLILPWLLGSYSDNDPNSEEQATRFDSMVTDNVENAQDVKNEELFTENSVNPNIVQADDDQSVFVSRVQPVDEIDNEVVSPIVEAKPKLIETPTINTQKVEPVKQKATVKKATNVEKKEPPKKVVTTKAPVVNEPTKPVDRGYIVSVGIFGDSANAKKLAEKLRTQNFYPSTRKEKFKNKQVTRVYMGPYPTRSKAGKVKLRLFEEQKIPSLLKEFP